MSDSTIEKIARLVDAAERILFITGAGLSADSGLPTYRGIGGLYDNQKTDEGIPIEVALSGQMMQSRPLVTWKYLLQIESSCRNAGFNFAHQVIADIERHKPHTWVLTQNVDGLHRTAGSKQVIEIHGRVDQLYCTVCGHREEVKDYSALSLPPECARCQSIVRPNVVLFGEMLPARELQLLHQQMVKGFDLVFSVGTSSLFPYIAQPVFEARNWGASVIEINPAITPVSTFVQHRLQMRAVDALRQIWQCLGYDVGAENFAAESVPVSRLH